MDMYILDDRDALAVMQGVSISAALCRHLFLCINEAHSDNATKSFITIVSCVDLSFPVPKMYTE